MLPWVSLPLCYHGLFRGKTRAIKSAIICATEPHDNIGILSPFYIERMSVAREIRWPLVLACLNLKISQEFNTLNWDSFYENQDRGFQAENLFPTVPCCRRCFAGDAPGWPQTDMHRGLLSDTPLPSVSPSVFQHISVLGALPWRRADLPYPLLCWQNGIFSSPTFS